MEGSRTTSSLHRIRNVRRVVHCNQPIISKHVIGFQTDRTEETPNRAPLTSPRRKFVRETAFDRIVERLRCKCDTQDLLLIIIPSKRHRNHVKLHAFNSSQLLHLGMTSVTHKELAKLKYSQAYQKYSILFGSQYMGLKAMALKTGFIKCLISTLNEKCSNKVEEGLKTPRIQLEQQTSIAGDYTSVLLKTQNNTTQTEWEVFDSIVSTSITEIKNSIKSMNSSMAHHKNDLDQFFHSANKMSLTLVIRPELIFGTLTNGNPSGENVTRFYIESYMPGECYLGCIRLSRDEMMQQFNKFPKLLDNVHVINDIYDIVPIPKWLAEALRKILFALNLEILYDAIGEFFFSWYKNISFLRKC